MNTELIEHLEHFILLSSRLYKLHVSIRSTQILSFNPASECIYMHEQLVFPRLIHVRITDSSPPACLTVYLPLNTTEVMGSGLPSFFLGRAEADSTTTRSMTKTRQENKTQESKKAFFFKKKCLVLSCHHA